MDAARCVFEGDGGVTELLATAVFAGFSTAAGDAGLATTETVETLAKAGAGAFTGGSALTGAEAFAGLAAVATASRGETAGEFAMAAGCRASLGSSLGTSTLGAFALTATGAGAGFETVLAEEEPEDAAAVCAAMLAARSGLAPLAAGLASSGSGGKSENALSGT
jgi:hypothetical protein